ncbi:hypothetical protein BH09PSE3_BH09PSE3_15480 [soil metagenome]
MDRLRRAFVLRPWRQKLTDYLTLFGIVFAVNLLPAFGPPTWSIIVIYGLNTRLPTPAIVLTGAIAAAAGRLCLAYAFRYLAKYVPEKTRRNVAAVRQALMRRKRNAFVGLGVFALSPVPSAQLFEAAGLSRLPLGLFTAAFFTGRTISYSIYALTAKSLAHSTIGESFRASLTSPVGIAIQIATIALLVAFTQIDWERYLESPPSK